MYRIMIVEDDRQISSAIKRGLSAWGCDVCETENFTAVTGIFRDYSPHLVLLDFASVLRRVLLVPRDTEDIKPCRVIFISSASDSMNIVMAMNMGGDDFVVKPFDMGVLTAKVRAHLRRAYDFGSQPSYPEHRGARLNTSEASLMYDGKSIRLTKNEYLILLTLLEKKGSIVSRSTLMERLWETDCYIDENTLTVNMTRLRKKLDSEGLCDFITTKKGLGYIIEKGG